MRRRGLRLLGMAPSLSCQLEVIEWLFRETIMATWLRGPRLRLTITKPNSKTKVIIIISRLPMKRIMKRRANDIRSWRVVLRAVTALNRISQTSQGPCTNLEAQYHQSISVFLSSPISQTVNARIWWQGKECMIGTNYQWQRYKPQTSCVDTLEPVPTIISNNQSPVPHVSST